MRQAWQKWNKALSNQPQALLFYKSSDIWDPPMPDYQKREEEPGEH